MRISREEHEAGENALATILESGGYDADPTTRPSRSAATESDAKNELVEEEGRFLRFFSQTWGNARSKLLSADAVSP